jgi:hypothetical protein
LPLTSNEQKFYQTYNREEANASANLFFKNNKSIFITNYFKAKTPDKLQKKN